MSLRSLLVGVLTGVAVCATYAAASNARPAMAAPPEDSCGTSSAPVSAHYVAALGTNHVGYISAVDLSGFDAGCNGDSAVLELWGNTAGDPTVPISGDSLLATSDSTLDTCTQLPLKTPMTVQDGNIDLTLCPTGGPAAYVSIHDLTLLSLVVNGQAVPVVSAAGTASSAGSSLTATVNRGGAGGIVAFTGADIEVLTIVGVLALLVGVAIALLSRRRVQRQALAPTPRRQI